MQDGDIPKYAVLLSQSALEQIIDYQNAITSSKVTPGGNLEKVLKNIDELQDVSIEKFIELILRTKKPKLFATHIKGDTKDWNNTELEILGNINMAVPVDVYDNAAWSPQDENFKEHEVPFEAELLYTPGPLLRKGRFVNDTPDYAEVTIDGFLEQGKYNKLIERRLSPLLAYAGETANKEGKKAVIIIPGLGCGVFAGKFKGVLGKHLNLAIQYTIERNGKNFKNIACVIFDPYEECSNESRMIEEINYRVRPFAKGNGRSQLDKPEEYAESGDDFSNCKLFKMVAWDHVSFPGNNFFMMERKTDDGVAAAATSSMFTITDVKGEYANGKYYPPSGYENWKQVVEKKKIVLRANKNVYVYTGGGDFLPLNVVEEKMLKK